jgi:hypothetical protein
MKGPGAPKNEEEKDQILTDYQLAMLLQQQSHDEEEKGDSPPGRMTI